MEDLLQNANSFSDKTLMQSLGIEFTLIDIESGKIEATMPVDARTWQPYGLLHGGASAALAETLGSYGSHLLVNIEGGIAVGVELNINHLRSKRHGVVTGKANLLHCGKSTHIWNIEIVDEDNKLIAVSRLTVMVKSESKSK